MANDEARKGAWQSGRGGKREGAGRPRMSPNGEMLDTLHVTVRARDEMLLASLGNGNVSAAVRMVLDYWRENRDVVYSMRPEQQMSKQVTLYTKEVEVMGIRHFVEVRTPDDYHLEAFDTAEEAQAYAAEIMQRDLTPFSISNLLGPR